MITKEEFAKRITGREYGSELTKQDEADAKASGLLVVFGSSDDNVEFRGLFDEEVGAYNGTTVLVHRASVIPEHDCDCEYCGYKVLTDKAAKIEAVWWGKNVCPWTYKTDLPHATFVVVEDGNPFCRGIVISAADLPEL